MKKSLIITILLLSALMLSAQGKHSFEIRDGHFWKDGEQIQLIGGEMHYPRIPHQYWRHRIQMAKAMGVNAISAYVFWNVHEPEPGKWDFSGDANVREFVKICGEEGLMVFLRPGPYVCAEWDYGGFPWWIQNIEGMEVRQDNEKFLALTKEYFTKLYEQVGDLQITKGGPIVMVQCENEFGSIALQRSDIPMERHHDYTRKVYNQLREVGFDVPFYTADGAKKIEGGFLPEALPTVDGERVVDNVKKAVDAYHPGGPYMIGEFYPGWLSHWAEKFPYRKPNEIASYVRQYLKNEINFSFYMVHGGTNFGFTSGANYSSKKDLQPDMTSYDYAAPISEAGWTTPMYDTLRNVIAKYYGKALPAIPDRLPVVGGAKVKINKVADVLEYLDTQDSEFADNPKTFEEMNQGFGYMLYSRQFNQPESGTLKIHGLRDFAVVYIDGEKVGELNRVFNKYEMPIDIPIGSTLQILVENWGRINYDAGIAYNHKGIIEPVMIDDSVVDGGWTMTPLPMTSVPNSNEWPEAKGNINGKPAVYFGSFKLCKVGDTFLDMSECGKGIVFVNGHNLGRYWKVGPQQTLYVPGCWLRKGRNEVVIFEQLNDAPITTLTTTDKPVLTDLKLH